MKYLFLASTFALCNLCVQASDITATDLYENEENHLDTNTELNLNTQQLEKILQRIPDNQREAVLRTLYPSQDRALKG